MLKKIITSIHIIMTLTMLQAAQKLSVPHIRQPFMKARPTIDGEIKPEEWAGAARIERLCALARNKEGTLTGGEASYWVGSDNQNLYIAMVSETAPGGKLSAKVRPAPEDGDARTWIDDSVELVIDTCKTVPKNKRRLYHANINSRNAIYDQRHTLHGGGEAWRGNWQCASKIIGDRWHFECTLPLKDLDITESIENKPIGIRICRNWQKTAGTNQTQWSPVHGPFISPDNMSTVTFDQVAPVVQNTQLLDIKEGHAIPAITVANPTEKPISAKLYMLVKPKSSAHSELKQQLILAPGEQKSFSLRAISADANEKLYTKILVSSPDGQINYYNRDFFWTVARPSPFFFSGVGDDKKVAFDFAYYPSVNSIRLRLDVSALATKNKVKGATIEIRNKKDKKLIASTKLTDFNDFSAHMDKWRIPELKEGNYEISATLDGVKLPAIIETFVRHKFPWEGNQIGKSDILLPPFTAIQVKNNTVSTILRNHQINQLGLWNQVEAAGVAILTSPMKLNMTINGKQHSVAGSDFQWQKKSDTKATAVAQWQAGPLAGKISVLWDYDGLMKWTIQVPKTTAPIESMKLVIPMKNQFAPLMHACTDGIRFNYAGYVPKGEGQVWNSSKAARNSIIGSFVPYLWVGSERQGLCIAAENDKGWITDSKIPCQELIRSGKTMDIVYNLISKPEKILKERNITLAFQTTPIKPMPENWRLKTFSNWKAQAQSKPENFLAFLGSCYYWGAEVPCVDYYPRFKDMNYLKKLAETRKTGITDKAYMKEWLKGYEKYYSIYCNTPEKLKARKRLYKNHVNGAFHIMKSKPKYLCFYTNGRGVRFDTPEGQTFINEWNRDEFKTRKWNYCGGVAYDMDPVASFRDYAIWYFKQMSDIILDSVYWDDLFLQANFNTTLTDAYRRPDGNIQPSSGLYNMREYVRRTGIMYTEMKRPVMNIVHMTNTAINPVLSFAQLNYTWEDKAGDSDFQDRYSRDYIRAESIGIQQGNIPIALWLVKGKDKEKLKWAARTGTGVALTHEIKISGGAGIFWKIYKLMKEFGYGQPNINVSQYWLKDHPVTFKNIDTSSLVLSKNKECLVLVCDWGNGGCATMSLEPSLGLGNNINAIDMETGNTLKTDKNSVLFDIKKHDFKLIKITPGEDS